MFGRRSQQGPFFFVHVQKSAGTALVSQLRARFGTEAIYPDDSDRERGLVDPDSVLSVERLQERWHARGARIKVVTGHFPLCVSELLGEEFRTLTLLREPVARTLSYLRHHRELTIEDRHLTLEEVYDDPFRFDGLIHNHMVKMFSLTTSEMTGGALTPVIFTEERLAVAKRNLASVDVIGVQEDYEGFLRDLTRTFRWRLGPPHWMNATQPVEIDPGLEERIAIDNRMDIELYEYALELVATRRSRR
jgi:hypothetical protein